MLQLIEKFMKEEQLILKYSAQNNVDKHLAKYEMYQDKEIEWKRELEEISNKYNQAYN